jgi:L-alanine-DL-glutamate epimerase-like enolase superfamily enzyme
MKIDRVDVWAVRIPYVNPIRFAFGTRTVGDYLILQIYTDTGVCGTGGSGALWPPVSGESIQGALQIVEESFVPQALLGEDPNNLGKIMDRLDRLCVGNTMTKSAVDFALHDLLGRARGVPVYDLLGGAQRDEIPQEWIVMLDKPEVMAEEAKAWVDAGYSGIKVKFGGDIKTDIRRYELIRKAIGDDIGMCVDANQAYKADGAIQVTNAIEHMGIKFMEEPVHRDDLDGLIKLRQHTNVALACDETAWTVKDAKRLIDLRLIDYLHAAPSRIGGLYRMKQYVDLGNAAGVTSVYSIYNSPALEYAASCHFAFAARPKSIPDEIVGIYNVHGGKHTHEIRESIANPINPPMIGGKITKPTGPGFGMELNLGYMKHYQLHYKSHVRK